MEKSLENLGYSKLPLLLSHNEKDLELRFEKFVQEFQLEAEKICSFRFVIKAGAIVTDNNKTETFSSLLERANHAVNSISDPFESQIVFFTQDMSKEIESTTKEFDSEIRHLTQLVGN